MQEILIKPGEYQVNLPVYDGIGTFQTKGAVTYHVSLPKSAQSQIRINEIMDLRDVIFIRISTPPDNTALTNPDKDVLTLSFTIPDFRMDGRETIRLFLWHDDRPVRDQNHMREIINNCNGVAATQPVKCGNGVLTYHL